jgi:WD40 repeat protein
MRRMWGVLGAGLIAGAVLAPLLSCNVIHGDLKQLTERLGVLSPCWSSDGESIYYIVSYGVEEWGALWMIDIESLETERITPPESKVTYCDISPDGSEICSGLGWHTWLYFVRTEDGVPSDSIPIIDSLQYSTGPRFSRQDPNIIYYLGRRNDTLTLHRLNRDDKSDEILFSLDMPEQTPCFGVSCDDSRAVIGSSIYSLDDENVIPVDQKLYSVDWHPTDPNLFIASMLDECLYFYDVAKDEWSKAKVEPYEKTTNVEVRFSPDGERVVFTTRHEESEFADYALWLFTLSD